MNPLRRRQGGNRKARGKKMVFVSANDHQEWPVHQQSEHGGEREREKEKDELYQDE